MKTKITMVLSLMLISVLTAAATVTLASCGKETAPVRTEAEVTVTVEVTSADGTKKDYVITTEAENLYEAMKRENLIEGEDGQYGFYLKVVAGERADYNLDGAYWAIYKSGEMLMTGMESTYISNGDHFELVYTK